MDHFGALCCFIDYRALSSLGPVPGFYIDYIDTDFLSGLGPPGPLQPSTNFSANGLPYCFIVYNFPICSVHFPFGIGPPGPLQPSTYISQGPPSLSDLTGIPGLLGFLSFRGLVGLLGLRGPLGLLGPPSLPGLLGFLGALGFTG